MPARLNQGRQQMARIAANGAAGPLGFGVTRETYLFLQLIRTEFPSVYLLRRV